MDARILVVEDDANTRSFLRQGLEEEGYAVTTAERGNKGLDLARADKFDLIVLDIMLPDGDGLEICKFIRAHDAHIPILFLTAMGTPENIAAGLDTGADDYIRSISTMQAEAEKLNLKTRAILSLAQTGFAKAGHKFEKLRVDEILIEVCENARRLYPNHRIEIDFSLLPEAAEKLVVEENPHLLQAAFSNIVANACKYSTKPVRVALAASQSDVIVVVSDAGIGIPEREMRYIYDPFYRGSITVESELRLGTTVQVSLPVLKAD